MPPWQFTSEQTLTCQHCGDSFTAKRTSARYCCQLCQSRSRPPRQQMRPERRKELYRKRCERPDYRERLRHQGRERAKRVRDFLQQYKLDQGCADCGYNKHHAALDFDHIDGAKEINVCHAKSIDQAKREIDKCEVVCSNCHRIRSYERYHDPCSQEDEKKAPAEAEA